MKVVIDIFALSPGVLLRTKTLQIGLFRKIAVIANRVIWNPYDECAVSGNLLIIGELCTWENVCGYPILSSVGHSWLLWSSVSGFAQNPENYVEFVN